MVQRLILAVVVSTWFWLAMPAHGGFFGQNSPQGEDGGGMIDPDGLYRDDPARVDGPAQ